MISQKVLYKRLIPLLIQNAGAHRKPRWVPVAKSKIYRIPKRPQIPEEERLELLRLNNNYKTQMRAMSRFFYDEMVKDQATQESASSEMSIRIEAEEWERCVELNDKWNQEVAREREERRKEEIAMLEQRALQKIERVDADMKKRIQKASERIRREKELSKTFITPETLDSAIDHALANPTDYNFAIDLKGNSYPGRDTQIIPHKDKVTSTSGSAMV